MARFLPGTIMGVAPSFNVVGAACGVDKPGGQPLEQEKGGFYRIRK